MTPLLSWPIVLGVALGGAAGAVVRLLLDRYLPGGILVANSLGCLLLGYLFGEVSSLSAPGAPAGIGILTPAILTILGFGLVGALSTFATVSLEAARRWMEGRRLSSIGLWSVHVLCGFLAAAAGVGLSSL